MDQVLDVELISICYQFYIKWWKLNKYKYRRRYVVSYNESKRISRCLRGAHMTTTIPLSLFWSNDDQIYLQGTVIVGTNEDIMNDDYHSVVKGIEGGTDATLNMNGTVNIRIARSGNYDICAYFTQEEMEKIENQPQQLKWYEFNLRVGTKGCYIDFHNVEQFRSEIMYLVDLIIRGCLKSP